MPAATLPMKRMDLLTMQVVDWHGPIVEIVFNRPITFQSEVDQVMEEASSFMSTQVAGHGDGRAYFITCYDRFSVSRECAPILQQRFVEFNHSYSKGDTRYGGSPTAKTIIISTAIRSTSRSEIHADREAALQSLRRRIDADLGAT